MKTTLKLAAILLVLGLAGATDRASAQLQQLEPGFYVDECEAGFAAPAAVGTFTRPGGPLKIVRDNTYLNERFVRFERPGVAVDLAEYGEIGGPVWVRTIKVEERWVTYHRDCPGEPQARLRLRSAR